jgi:hypothetical protein
MGRLFLKHLPEEGHGSVVVFLLCVDLPDARQEEEIVRVGPPQLLVGRQRGIQVPATQVDLG